MTARSPGRYWWLKSKTQNKMEWNQNKHPSACRGIQAVGMQADVLTGVLQLMPTNGCVCEPAQTLQCMMQLKIPQGHFYACRRGHYLPCSGCMNKLVGQKNNSKRHPPMILVIGLGIQKSKIFITQYPHPLWLPYSPPRLLHVFPLRPRLYPENKAGSMMSKYTYFDIWTLSAWGSLIQCASVGAAFLPPSNPLSLHMLHSPHPQV